MENAITNTPQTTACAVCQIDAHTDDAFCTTCGYPLKGTEQEQQSFITYRNVSEIDLMDYQEKIRKGGQSLYWVAGAMALGSIIDLAKAPSGAERTATLIAGIIISTLFVLLGLWSSRKPFAAMVSGSCLFAIIVISAAVVNPLTLISGIILKIIVVGCLVKGIRAAMDAEKLKKEVYLG